MQRAEKEGLRALERELRYRMGRLHSLKAGEDAPADLAARLAAERLFARRRSDSALTDERLLAAGEAEAYYQYLLLTEPQEGAVTSFKAGDVSYSTAGNAAERARQRRDLLAAQAGDLLRDPAEFVFRRV